MQRKDEIYPNSAISQIITMSHLYCIDTLRESQIVPDISTCQVTSSMLLKCGKTGCDSRRGKTANI